MTSIPIILSTACYHNKYEKVIDAAMQAIKPSHKIDGSELSFLTKKELKEFKPNETILEYSRNNQIFMHAPAKDIVYSINPESNKIFTKLKNDYDKLEAKQITFHLENVESIDYLASQMKGYNINLENPDVKNTTKKYFKTLENYLESYDIGLTLDVEHARNDLPKFLEPGIIKRISEIHYSNYNPVFNHDCYSTVFKRFNTIIAAIKMISKPVVIEVDLKKDSQLALENIDNSRFVISKEIALLRNNLISS